jgi:hypothetical protein
LLPLRTQGHEACEKSVRVMQLRAICVGCLSSRNKRASRKSTSPPGRETATPLVMVALCVICALATCCKHAHMPRGPSSVDSFASKAPCKSSTLLAGAQRLRSRLGLLPARPRPWTCSDRRLSLGCLMQSFLRSIFRGPAGQCWSCLGIPVAHGANAGFHMSACVALDG